VIIPGFVGASHFLIDILFPIVGTRHIFASSTFKHNIMKAKIIIFAAILGFQVNTLFAANSGIRNFVSLAPVIPSEAVYTDVVPELNMSLLDLAPITPNEVEVMNITPEPTNDLETLAPMIPSEAVPDDSSSLQPMNTFGLAPITPSEAVSSDLD